MLRAIESNLAQNLHFLVFLVDFNWLILSTERKQTEKDIFANSDIR